MQAWTGIHSGLVHALTCLENMYGNTAFYSRPLCADVKWLAPQRAAKSSRGDRGEPAPFPVEQQDGGSQELDLPRTRCV